MTVLDFLRGGEGVFQNGFSFLGELLPFLPGVYWICSLLNKWEQKCGCGVGLELGLGFGWDFGTGIGGVFFFFFGRIAGYIPKNDNHHFFQNIVPTQTVRSKSFLSTFTYFKKKHFNYFPFAILSGIHYFVGESTVVSSFKTKEAPPRLC
jgi:hypothetical protein